MIRSHDDTQGEMHEMHRIIRDAGRKEERERIMSEIRQDLLDIPVPEHHVAYLPVQYCLERVLRRLKSHE